MPLTHWRAPWTTWAGFDGTVVYPGEVVDSAELAPYNKKIAEALQPFTGYFDKDVMEKEIAVVVKRAKELGFPLYCGEFGCYPTIDDKNRFN